MGRRGEQGLQDFLRALGDIGGPATLAEVSDRTKANSGTDWERGHRLILSGEVIQEKVGQRKVYRLPTQEPITVLPPRSLKQYKRVNLAAARMRQRAHESKAILAVTAPIHVERQIAMGISREEATRPVMIERLNKLGAG